MALDITTEQEGGKLKAVASGTLPSGQPVVVNADGTVSVVDPAGGTNAATAPDLGSSIVFRSADTDDITSVYDTNSNRLVVAYIESTSSGAGKAIVGEVSGGSITFGTPVAFVGGNLGGKVKMAFDSNANKVVISFRDDTNSTYGTSIVGTVSGTSISFGTPTVFVSGRAEGIATTFDSNANKVVVFYSDSDGSSDGKALVGTVSGTSISFGSTTTFETGYYAYPDACFDSTNNKVVTAYQEFNGGVCYAIVGTVSGTSISFGTKGTFLSGRADGIACEFDPDNSKVVVLWRNDDGTSWGQLAVGTVSGTSISFGSADTWYSAKVYQKELSYDPVINKFVISFRDGSDSNIMKYLFATISGNSATFSTVVASTLSDSRAVSSAYDPDSGSHLVSFTNGGNVYGTTQIVNTTTTGTNLTSENYIGMSGGAVDEVSQSAGTVATFNSGQTAEAAIAFDSVNNKIVIAYIDTSNSSYGTAIVGTVGSETIAFGTPVVFEAANTDQLMAVFDSNSNKIVIAYRDRDNSNSNTAIVGTVSSNSISFGTPVVYNPSGSGTSGGIAFDSTNNRVVICYRDVGNSSYGTAIVGSVSGTSISFGTEVVYNSSDTRYSSPVFDSSNDKVVIGYRDDGNSSYGNAVVGTISGTSISFGSEANFESAYTNEVSGDFDSINNKIVYSYIDEANSGKGTAVVGTVSGTSISFGTPVVFENASVDFPATVFDPNSGKIVIAYRDKGNSNDGTFVVGEVSGTSIIFETPAVFDTGNMIRTKGVFDSNSNKVVVSFTDESDSTKGHAVALQANFISRGQVASGGNATVDIVGTVSTNQLGLTAGQQYYVQTDGTLSETPADPSVLAGTALSATKMTVKS